jgi:hypothetical protein
VFITPKEDFALEKASEFIAHLSEEHPQRPEPSLIVTNEHGERVSLQQKCNVSINFFYFTIILYNFMCTNPAFS